MIEAAELPASATVVEIGPGQGILTRALTAAVPAGQVLAIEVDGTLTHQLRGRVSKRVKVIHADALRFDYATVAKPWHVVSNLPYQITSPLLHQLIGSVNPPETMTLMVQREVAERLTAVPKTRERGLLTVVVEWYGPVERCFDVFPDAFVPPPKVWSTVIHLVHDDLLGSTLRVEPRIRPQFEPFVRFLKVGFSQKRRQLHHPFATAFPMLKPELDTIFESAGIERTMRAEELTFEQWVRLFNECSHRLSVHL